ncbi:hypothetical protein [Azospirillum isscasi]|uniref:PilZ domain-containing protein n=1 Tax=Azospirillum isscasi TaxID=3053926 RepID=A0ABU0WBT8_9PROT|nr:hypothetical protein [Azospirillum isscasi]MDQ2101573.1 hypothetical protein [Azospirillum isscasi]
MGLFDFLKVTVKDEKKTAPRRAGPSNGSSSVIEFDGKSFPLAAISHKGFVATGFDGSLIPSQTARITVRVDDASGKFTFAATVTIEEVKGGSVSGAWNMLPPEVEATIRKYLQIRKQKAGK